MQVHKNEVTTGLLVLLTFGLLIGLLVFLGLPGLLHPVKTYRVYFDNAEGIHPGAPVLLAGRQIGTVRSLRSPVPLAERPSGHTDYEVSIDVQVNGNALIYREVTVVLTTQGLMGQPIIDFRQSDEGSGLVPNHAEFVGQRLPDISEVVGDNLKRLTGEGSELALTIKNIRIFTDKLNDMNTNKVLNNVEQLTDTLKREPWRLIWPSKKSYPGDDKDPDKRKKREEK